MKAAAAAAAAGSGASVEPARKRPSSRTHTSTYSFDGGALLPDHLVREILILLPVKTLIRFKTVHPSWQLLISDPSFISDHGHRQSCKFYYGIVKDREHTASPPKLIPITSPAHDPEPSIPAGFFDGEKALRACLGPCFGIYFLRNRHEVALWNSGTRELKMLPLVKVAGKKLSGFGFGSVVNADGCIDFKVVGFGVLPQNNTEGIHVYSLSSNSWQLVRPRPEIIGITLCYPEPPATVNASFHWMAFRGEDSPYFILYFDLKSETFGTIELPKVYPVMFLPDVPPELIKDYAHLRMVHIDDNTLCFAVSYPYVDKRFEIWAMREYGVESTWYKYASVEHGKFSETRYVDELFFRDFDENLLSCEGMKAFHNAYGPANCKSRVFRYEESLISLGGETRKRKLSN